MSRPAPIYRAVRLATDGPGSVECWGIRGGWKTINSTMGLYRTKEQAEAAIARMTVEPRVVAVRKIRRA